MLSSKCAALLLSLTLFIGSTAGAQPPDAKPDLGANAAMKYWQAFALLPPLDKDQEELLERWNRVPLDAAALTLIDKSLSSRTYLHRGAKLPRCDWNLSLEDGAFLRLPHLPKARTLERLTALHARREFEQGHWQTGWDDVIALLKLARHVGSGPTIIANLVGYRIEMTAIEAAAPWLPESKGVLAGASADVDALPVGPSLQQMVIWEKQIGPVWLIGALKEAEQRKEGGWREVWNELFDAAGEGENAESRDSIRSIRTFEQAVKMLEDLLPLNDELAKLTVLPWKEFDARYAEFIKRTKSPHPLAGYLLPALDGYVAATRRIETQRELFKAAVAVAQGGPDKVKDFRDPFGEGLFGYRALDRGFELKSTFRFVGQPVLLTVGNRK